MGETNGLSCVAVGSGPPLVVLSFLPEAGEPAGLTWRYLRRVLRPFAERFTVYVPNRAPGLPPATTMGEMAAHYAEGLAPRFAGPVPVLGASTGGSLALQLAADHPRLVSRLALAATACTLGPIGRRAQRAFIERARAGRRPSPALAEVSADGALARTLLKGVLWLSDGRGDHADAATMLSAEDGFDLRGRLGDITAPTLLLHGDRDVIYPTDLARETAEGIPDARLITYAGRTHAGTLSDPRFPTDTRAFLAEG